MTIILGIDPGSRVTGFGVIEKAGTQNRYITSGCIRLPDAPLPERLRCVFVSIHDIIEQYQPQQCAVESVFMARNAASALKLGQARGAAIVAAASCGLEVVEYSARQIKQSVVGTGAAKKQQVQHMVQTLLALSGVPAEDAADALAAALCHAHSQQGLLAQHGVTAIRRGRMR